MFKDIIAITQKKKETCTEDINEERINKEEINLKT